MITRRQALALGISSNDIVRMVRSQELVRLKRGIYRSAYVPQSFQQRVLAAVVDLPPVTAVTGLAAAHLWGIHPPEPKQVEVVADHRVRGAAIRAELARGDVRRLQEIPLTTVEWTVAELAPTMLSAEFTLVLDRALSIDPEARERRTTVKALVLQLARLAKGRQPGSKQLRAALRVWRLRPTMESVAEAAMLRAMLRAGIPLPEAQYPVDRGGRMARLDFAWPKSRFAVEVDGLAYHSDTSKVLDDGRRVIELRLRGWDVLRVPAADALYSPEMACEVIAKGVGRRR